VAVLWTSSDPVSRVNTALTNRAINCRPSGPVEVEGCALNEHEGCRPQMNGERKHRRMTFSIRTLLVAVTVFCVWLGWQVNIVRSRRSMATTLNSNLFIGQVVPVEDAIVKRMKTIDIFRKTDPDKSFSIPWYRRMLGDEAVLYVVVPDYLMEEAARRFPEAAIVDKASVE
jgi:hypothetical protein